MLDENSRQFMKLVETHERAWGIEQYKGRPNLHDVLLSPVVVFWLLKDDKREIISLHNDLNDIERYLLRQLISGKANERKLVAVYQNHKRMTVKSIKILFAEAAD